jgi:hypothetical protein
VLERLSALLVAMRGDVMPITRSTVMPYCLTLDYCPRPFGQPAEASAQVGGEGGEPVRPSAANGPERSEGAQGKLKRAGPPPVGRRRSRALATDRSGPQGG